MQTKTEANKPVQLPKGYVSWSSLQLLEQSEERWVDKYCNPDYVERSTIEQEFGKSFAEVMEGQDSSDDIVALIKMATPKYEQSEVIIEATLKAMGRSVKLLGRMDSYKEENHDFIDHKTGKTKWTQKMADKHGQLLFYKVMIYILYRAIPISTLVWIQTEDSYDEEEGRQIVFTGQLPVSFVVNHTYADILKMMQRIMKGALRMEELYQQYINNIFT